MTQTLDENNASIMHLNLQSQSVILKLASQAHQKQGHRCFFALILSVVFTLEFFLFFLQQLNNAFRDDGITPIGQFMLKIDFMLITECFALTLSKCKPN